MNEPELFLRLQSRLYRLRGLPGAKSESSVWELTSDKGDQYTVHRGKYGPECTCMDWISRRANTPVPECKHIAALKSVGVFS